MAAATIAFLPIFAANVVFAKRFASTADATAAFGANLLGAMVGGCLEYPALLVGYPGLLVVAALLYAGAFALLPRARAGIALAQPTCRSKVTRRPSTPPGPTRPLTSTDVIALSCQP